MSNQWNEPDEFPVVGKWAVRHTIPEARDSGYRFGKNFDTLEEALTFCREVRKRGDYCWVLVHVSGEGWLKITDLDSFVFVPEPEEAS